MKSSLTLVISILIISLIYVLGKSVNEYESKINKLHDSNLSLQIQIDTTNANNKYLLQDLAEKELLIDSLLSRELTIQKAYNDNKIQLKTIKKEYEKINRIDYFNSNDIIRYFADSIDIR